MTNKQDGMDYAPKGKPNRVVGEGEFRFAAIGLDHGHIYGMCNGLMEAGAELAVVYDPDLEKVQRFADTFPQAKAAASEEEILNDPQIKLIAGACIPAERGALGLRALDHGKHYFVDKPAFTTLDQVDRARRKTKETGLKWGIY
ncbi:Gfo/Idh/MocA family oxidoreductase [Paenibacillus macerans]|uniref:Gfo/Idh/MocA family oxidoreductase n=1 Tax=Paenibacillus macerans TaxID=44252 RepID=UPI003D324339